MEDNSPPQELSKKSPSISTRGVPSEESIYLPRHDSTELRSFQDSLENPTRNLWNHSELVNFIFSKKHVLSCF
jgi:hypothetical protein